MLLAISQILHPVLCMLSNLWFFLSTRLFAINACSPFHIPILHTHLMHHTLRRTLYNPASYLQDVLRVSTSLQPQLTGHNSPSFYNRLLLNNDFSRFLPFFNQLPWPHSLHGCLRRRPLCHGVNPTPQSRLPPMSNPSSFMITKTF